MPKRIPPELGTTRATPEGFSRWQTQFVLERSVQGVHKAAAEVLVKDVSLTPYDRTQTRKRHQTATVKP